MSRKMISEMILVMLVVGLLALAVQTQSVKAESTTLVGTVLYDEKPVSQFTSKAAVLWVRNESSGEGFPTSPTYDTSTGEYSIPDMPPGEYGISVFIDNALPFNGKDGFAGDFDGWNSPVVVAEGQPIVNQNLTVLKTLHLTSPVDNAAVIGPWSYPEDTYATEEMTFKWDVLAGASSYHASIEEYEEPSTYVGLVANNVTSDVKWNLALPMNVENHFYVFNLYAYNINDLMVGKLMVPYSSGYGWEYDFRLALALFPDPNVTLNFSPGTSIKSVSVTEYTNVTSHYPQLTGAIGPIYNITLITSGNVTVGIHYDPSLVNNASELVIAQFDFLRGDVNGDFKVSLGDLVILAKAYGSKPGNPNWNSTADIDGNGVVGLSDLVILASNYGETAKWIDRPTTVDTANNFIYCTTDHFSGIGIHLTT